MGGLRVDKFGPLSDDGGGVQPPEALRRCDHHRRPKREVGARWLDGLKATWGLGPSLAATLACREDARPGLGLTFCVGREGSRKGLQWLAMAATRCH